MPLETMPRRPHPAPDWHSPQRDVPRTLSEGVMKLHALCRCSAVSAAQLNPRRQLRADEPGPLVCRCTRAAAAVPALRLHVAAAVFPVALHLGIPVP